MFPSSASSTRFIKIILALSDYPILGKRIRERMRQELFDQDIISPRVFEAKVREMALRTQQNEGLTDPFAEEQNQTWEVRLERIR
ncbi:MAG: hypothetical protein JW750_05060, partial [Anaerolineaceae bacterium]|nr:hypothetical protein [Anaerolineaceae bacterium]